MYIGLVYHLENNMFFAGLGIGIGLYLLVLFLSYKGLKIGYCIIILLVGLVASFAGLGILAGIGYLVTVAVLFVIGLYLANRHKGKTDKAYKDKYINHCWNCGAPINSEKDQLCPRCGKHYICSNCGMCYCDNPQHKLNILEESTLIKTKSCDNLTHDNSSSLVVVADNDVEQKENGNLCFSLYYSIDIIFDILTKAKKLFNMCSKKDFEKIIYHNSFLKDNLRKLNSKQFMMYDSAVLFCILVDEVFNDDSINIAEKSVSIGRLDKCYGEIETIYNEIKNNVNEYSLWLN